MKLQTAKIEIGNATGKDAWKKTRVYIWPEGESIMENMQNRRSRPYNEFRKQVIPGVLKALGLPAGAKVKWSQYAGCSCPCSPGFIVEDSYGKHVSVTVTA